MPVLLLLTAGGAVANRYRVEQTGLAASYTRAERALADGDYDAAIAAFAQAGSYRDAADRRAGTQAELAPYRDAYFDGAAALDAGRYDDAIASLLTVARVFPSYEDTLLLLDEARTQRDADLARDAEVAIARHDWLGADRALSAILGGDPDNAEVAARLATLRRDHAPIIFTREGALYAIGPDLTDERLITNQVPVSAPAWSPDRSQIAFFIPNPDKIDVAKLAVVDVNGGNLRQIADHVLMDWWPSWSPDGTKIAFTSVDGFSVGNEHGYASIHVVDVVTGVDTDVTGDQFSSVTSATWSPESDRLAFINQRIYGSVGLGNVRPKEGEVLIANLVTGEMVSVTEDRLLGAARVAWSPTEDKLLVWAKEGNTAWYENPHTAIHLIDLATGASESLTQHTQVVGPPYWSPDGTRFAYVEGNGGQGNSVVRVRWLTGRREAGIGISRPVSSALTWAPDGKALIAIAADLDQGSTLIPLPDGPGSQVNLPLNFDMVSFGLPQWSPFNVAQPPASPTVGGTALDATLYQPEE